MISAIALFTTLENLENREVSKLYIAIIGAKWSKSSAPYTKNANVTRTSSKYVPIIDVVLSSTPETAQRQLEARDWISKIEICDNGITITCLKDKTAIAVPIRLKVDEIVS